MTEGNGRPPRPRYPAYRPSDVVWLGQIPANWEVKRLRYAVCRNDGGTWGEDAVEGGTIVLRSTDMAVDGKWIITDPARRLLSPSEVTDARVLAGDLVVTKSSGSALHLGKAALVTSELEALRCCFSNFMQRLRPCSDINSGYLYRILNSPVGREQLNYLGTTTTGLANLNGDVIGRVTLPVPPPAEQQAIAAFLDRETARIDALLAAKQRLLDLLAEKRAALITRAVTRGLDPGVPLKESGVAWLGQIPAHWEVKKLKYAATLKSGDSITAEDIRADDEFPVYGGNGLRGYTSSYTHDGHFVLIGRQGALCGNINYGKGMFWASEHAVVVSPVKPVATTWLGELLRTMDLNQYSVSAAQPGLAVDRVKQLYLPFPQLSEQNAIACYLDREIAHMEKLATLIEESIHLLRERRMALITAAVTGQIDVRGGEG